MHHKRKMAFSLSLSCVCMLLTVCNFVFVFLFYFWLQPPSNSIISKLHNMFMKITLRTAPLALSTHLVCVCVCQLISSVSTIKILYIRAEEMLYIEESAYLGYILLILHTCAHYLRSQDSLPRTFCTMGANFCTQNLQLECLYIYVYVYSPLWREPTNFLNLIPCVGYITIYRIYEYMLCLLRSLKDHTEIVKSACFTRVNLLRQKSFAALKRDNKKCAIMRATILRYG